MATVSKGNTFTSGETVTHTKLNNLADLATISDIVNADISASAAIADTKLAQITTASKVGGTAIYALNSLPSSVGQIPIAQIPTIPNTSLAVLSNLSLINGSALFGLASVTANAGIIPAANRLQIKAGTTTRDMTAASGSAAITGVGFTPKVIFFITGISGTASFDYMSWGFSDGSNHYATGLYDTGTQLSSATKCILAYDGGSNAQTGSISSFDSDGFTIGWTKAGAPGAGTLAVHYLVIG